MDGQMILSSKGFLADGAAVRLLSRVDLHVSLQSPFIPKALVTNGALLVSVALGFAAFVDLHVTPEIMLPTEASLTKRAVKGLLSGLDSTRQLQLVSRVMPHVSPERNPLVKGRLADRAAERLLSGVDSHVRLERSFVGKHFTAGRTLVDPGVNWKMSS